MSIASEITRLQNAKASIKTSIENKGVTVPSATKLDGYSTLIDSIQTGSGGNADKWVRPSNFPNLDSLDISQEEVLYLTYEANLPNSLACIRPNATGTWYVDIGTVSNGVYTVKSTDTLSGDVIYMKALRGYDEKYVVLRIRGTIKGRGTYTNGFFRETYDLNGEKLSGALQSLVEIYGRMPNCTSLYAFVKGLEYIRAVKLIGMAELTTLERAFNECPELESVDISDTTKNVLTYYLFGSSPRVRYAYLHSMKMHNMTSFSGNPVMFSDIETWKVTSLDSGHLSSAFAGWFIRGQLDLSGWTLGSTANIDRTFQNCKYLEGLDIHTWTTTNISNAFNTCGIRQLPNLNYSIITNIGSAFKASGLTGAITIPETTLTSFGDAFADCRRVTKYTVPASYTSLVAKAFSNLSSCTEIHFLATTPPTMANANALNTGMNANLKIYVPYSADHSVLTAYQTASNWSTFASIIMEESA